MTDYRILVVDDERLVLRSIEKTLLRAGFDVEPAADISTALEMFKEARDEGNPFDMAIVDLQMPNFKGEDDPNAGLDLLSSLMGEDDQLPVIVLTAFDDVARTKEALRRGARTYFVKGREAELVNIVKGIADS
jgi:DNA-binding response OmpR family regulator